MPRVHISAEQASAPAGTDEMGEMLAPGAGEREPDWDESGAWLRERVRGLRVPAAAGPRPDRARGSAAAEARPSAPQASAPQPQAAPAAAPAPMVAGPASEAASAEPAGEAWLEDSLAPFNEMANAIANAFLLSAQELEGRRADDRVLFERVIKNHDKQVRMLGGALSEIERRLGPIDGLVAEQQSLAERAESNFSKFSVEVRDLGQRLRAAEDDHKQTEKAIQERTDAVSTALNGRCAQLAAGLEAAREEVKQLTGALADARTEIKTLTSRVDRQAAAIRAMYQSEMLSSI